MTRVTEKNQVNTLFLYISVSLIGKKFDDCRNKLPTYS